LLAGACGVARAQVNTEALRQSFDEQGFFGDAALTFGLKSGNTDIFKLATRVRLDYAKEPYHTFLVLSYERGEKDGELFVNQGFAHLRAVRGFTPRVAGELFAQEEFDDFVLLASRTLLGAGARFALGPSSDRLRLYLGTGAMWERERYDDPVEPEQELVRSTSYLSVSWHAAERIGLGFVAYYQPALEQLSDYRALVSLDFDLKLTEHLGYLTAVRLRYDSEPVGQVVRHDLDLNVGLKASF